jgi:hypothetical protein
MLRVTFFMSQFVPNFLTSKNSRKGVYYRIKLTMGGSTCGGSNDHKGCAEEEPETIFRS